MQITPEKELIDTMVSFVRSIGIPVAFGPVPQEKAFLPGICIEKAGLLIDSENLRYPGDILHEAGHLAVARPAKRAGFDGVLNGVLDEDQGEEMMAIAWSYAAAVHIGIDPHIVFHEGGYADGGKNIVENFSEGRFFAVSLLQWTGMAHEPRTAQEKGLTPYPHMIKWLRE